MNLFTSPNNPHDSATHRYQPTHPHPAPSMAVAIWSIMSWPEYRQDTTIRIAVERLFVNIVNEIVANINLATTNFLPFLLGSFALW